MTADGVNNYTFEGDNRLKTGAGVTYTSDGDGRRMQESTGKPYWYGMGSDPLAETDASGNVASEYVFFGSQRGARCHVNATPPDSFYYYFADHLGTTRIIADASGIVLDDSDLYPFGGERVVMSSSGNTHKFTGEEHDGESGLNWFSPSGA